MKKRGGGVLIAVNNSIVSEVIPSSVNNIEHLFVKCGRGKSKMLVGAVYIPPNSSSEVYTDHCIAVENVYSSDCFSDVIFFGDFNLPEFKNWEVLTSGYDSEGSKVSLPPVVKPVIESFSLLQCQQLNVCPNSTGRLLDLIFSQSNSTTVIYADIPLVDCDSHHPALSILIPTGLLPSEKVYSSYYDFKHSDYSAINSSLNSINWAGVLGSLSVDEAFYTFYDILYGIVYHHTPLKCVYSSTYPQWFTSELRSLVRTKKCLHKKFKITGAIQDYEAFVEIRKQCKSLSTQCYFRYMENVGESVTRNPKYFWSYVRSVKKYSEFPNNLHLDGVTANNVCDISNLFAEYFSSVYSHIELDDTPKYNFDNNISLSKLQVSVDEIHKKLKSIDISKGCGPDNIPPLAIKNCSDSLVYPLFILFDKSLQCGTFPELLKLSKVVPVFKCGQRCNIKNYRPVVIQSYLAKLFESLVVDKLEPVLRHVIDPRQHGFSKGKSTSTNLLILQQSILSGFEMNKQTDVIYTDFSKAFDKVNHQLLLAKLEAMGIFGTLLEWISSYLSKRRQFVLVKNHKSVEYRASSGVPQGSHLGPLLFNVFINDVGLALYPSHYLLYADDLKIFATIDSIGDCYQLQNSLNKLISWNKHNAMVLNVEKCCYMSFSRKSRSIDFSYTMNDYELSKVDCFKDLGVFFDPKLNFNYHCLITQTKALKTLGCLLRFGRDLKNIYCLRMLYVSLVRPMVEYGCCVWSPHYNVHINIIERVQRKFINFVKYKFGLQHLDYNSILLALNLEPLHVRRKNLGILLLHKLVTSTIDAPELLGAINFRVPTCGVRDNAVFSIPYHARQYSYFTSLSRLMRDANGTCRDVDFFRLSTTQIRSYISHQMDW